MSDVSKTNELIVAKLRKAAKQAEWYQALDPKLLTAAADALESRQPSENDREVLAKQLRDIGAVRKVDQDCSCQDCEGAAEWVNAPLSVVLDHFKTNVSDAEPTHLVCAWCPQPARGDAWHNDGKLHPSCGQIDHGQGWVPPYTPRAAVPDAAIRELTEAIRLTVEYVGNDMLPAIEGWDWYDALVKYAPEVAQAFVDKPIHFPKQTDAATEGDYHEGLEEGIKIGRAERDAALAAVERVRAILSVKWRDGGVPSRWHSQLTAALDGAPEPEVQP